MPCDFDIEDLARIVGVWPELEFMVADDDGTRYHFAGEVLAGDERVRRLDQEALAAQTGGRVLAPPQPAGDDGAGGSEPEGFRGHAFTPS